MLRLFKGLKKSVYRRQAMLRPDTPALYPVPPSADVHAMSEGLRALEAFADPQTKTSLDDECPIVIAGVGWRVGSTLLQRLCCSDRRAIVWGEVLGNMGLINRISEAICIAKPDAWPFPDMWLKHRDFVGKKKETLADEFIANLYPSAGYLREGLQQFMFGWLGEPARALGFKRWGLKETRLSAADALFLRWLFPKAVFLPLIRHPFDAYQSCQAMGGDFWIEPRTNSPERFAEHWNRLAMSWVEGETHISVPVIRYEDLVSGDYDFGGLRTRLDLDIQPDTVMSKKAGASPHKERFPLNKKTMSLIRRVARKGMEAYCYDSREK
jgi:hypothetical protein